MDCFLALSCPKIFFFTKKLPPAVMFSSNLFLNFFFCNAVDNPYVFTGLSNFVLPQHDISSSFDYLQILLPPITCCSSLQGMVRL